MQLHRAQLVAFITLFAAASLGAQDSTRANKLTSALPAPGQLTAVLSKGSVQLTWATVANAVSYRVWRSRDASAPAEMIGGFPAKNIPTGGMGQYLDLGHNAPAVYSVTAVAGDNTVGKKAMVTYEPAIARKIELPVGKKP